MMLWTCPDCGAVLGEADKLPQVEHVCHQRGAADLRREIERLRTALEQIYSVSREYAMYDVLRGFDQMQAIAKAALAASDGMR